MIKALPKSLQVNANFHGHFGHGVKSQLFHGTAGTVSAEAKTLQLSPAMPPLSPASRGKGFPMTGALDDGIITD